MERLIANRHDGGWSIQQVPVRIQKKKKLSGPQHASFRRSPQSHNKNKQFTLSFMIDIVWHQGLLHNMEKIGLRGTVLEFVEDFLKNRSNPSSYRSSHVQHVLPRKWNALWQCVESTTVHHHDQRLTRIVKRRQARTVCGRQLDVEVWTEPVSLVQRRPAVPNEDGKILRRMGLQDLGQQAVAVLFSQSNTSRQMSS